ncbi:DNA polymerase III, subunit gamma and tau [Bellilinea caldifistulae]|uniref:DNA polymerase III subunit gamma/tau n=1 Tax=Bellilinea caldifistulae TaxID=360411 RepID=UPI000784532B|nr:DNA polymerase III subunit gamma/tau [Bellilinea caldifistulae]GAP11724.1 DNA polymerase III, subunit gamma and tau [Bellilinea caldifistulae]
MSQALYRKWRPRLWDQVVGQDHVVQTLQNAIRGERVGHAYLFAGPRGTGKTTTARLLAKAVNCLAESPAERPCDRCEHCQAVNNGRFLDLIEIDAASNTSVDDVRDLRDKINFAPTQGKYKVYIIDEVHMLSTAAFNALLKTLEEPPPHAIFILATTEIHKIPATVLSRCQRHEFRRIPVRLIVQHLQHLCRQEKVDVDEETLTLIARQATGSLRDAISLLDQLASTGGPIRLADAQQVLGTAAGQAVIELVEALLERDAARGLNTIHMALDSGSDPRQFARQVVDYCRNVLLVRLGNGDMIEATPEQQAQMSDHARRFTIPALLDAVQAFNLAASDQRSAWQPALPLEMALAQLVSERSAPAGQEVGRTVEPAVSTPTASHGVGKADKAAVSKTEAAPKPGGQSPLSEMSAERPTDSQMQAEPSAVEPSAPTQNSPAVELQTILENWQKIRQRVKSQSSPVDGLLNSCKSITMRNGVLQLGFGSEVLKTMMEKGNNLKITRKAIRDVLGVEIEIACIVVQGKGGQIQLDADIEADGMVSTAIRLGGKIVHKE